MQPISRTARVAAAVALIALAAPLASSTANRARRDVPANTKEPFIEGPGAVAVGTALVGNRGTWTGTQPITYRYQWLRCNDNGESCQRISSATGKTYTTTETDVGRTIRFRVTATNSDGETSATSNPTAEIASGPGAPEETSPPTISGDAVVGAQLTANVGTWDGAKPITYAINWQSCDSEVTTCKGNGVTATTYTVAKNDAGHRLRIKVIAENDKGQTTGLSAPTAAVKPTGESQSGIITLPTGEKSIAVAAVPKGERLIVDQARFTPNPVRSRSTPIEVRIKVTDTQHHVVRGALVFIRSTPLVASVPADAPTANDGWITYRLHPESDFPLKNGYSVQFFVKAYRHGDPTLAGISGTRLVQVATEAP
jgi:hypothetical protein